MLELAASPFPRLYSDVIPAKAQPFSVIPAKAGGAFQQTNVWSSSALAFADT
jgi:hypothetical protein